MKQFTMVYLYSEHYYEESFYHESEEAYNVLRTEHSGQSFRKTLSLCCDPDK